MQQSCLLRSSHKFEQLKLSEIHWVALAPVEADEHLL